MKNQKKKTEISEHTPQKNKRMKVMITESQTKKLLQYLKIQKSNNLNEE
jgi:hypothetical protein